MRLLPWSANSMSDFGAGIFDQDPTPAGGKEPQPQVPGQEPATGRRSRRRRAPAEDATAPSPHATPQVEAPAAEAPVAPEGEGRRRSRRRGRKQDGEAESAPQAGSPAAPATDRAPEAAAPDAPGTTEPGGSRTERAPYREADWDAPPARAAEAERQREGGDEDPDAAREDGVQGEPGAEPWPEGERRRRRRRGRRRGRGRRDELDQGPREAGPETAAADGPDADLGEDPGFEDRVPEAAQDAEVPAQRQREGYEPRVPHHREHPRDRGHGRDRDRHRDGDRGPRDRDDRHRHHRGHGHHVAREVAPAAPAAPARSVAVFVDLVALENEVRTAGGEVAFRKLLSFLADGRKVARAICYLPAGTPARGSIAGSGFQVQSLTHAEELPLRAAVDAAELSADLDAVMLVPGTHGLMALAGVLREKGMAVETAGFGAASGGETIYRRLGRESMFVP